MVACSSGEFFASTLLPTILPVLEAITKGPLVGEAATSTVTVRSNKDRGRC